MSVKSREVLRKMDEEMRVGVRLHKRLFGLNDILDNELNHKVNKITKEQKRARSQLETDMECLKRQLSRTSISSGESNDHKSGSSKEKNEWDKPSSTVLKARMMLKSSKTIKKDKENEQNGRPKTDILKNVIPLHDLPRIRYEEKQKKNTPQLTSTPKAVSDGDTTDDDEFVEELFPKRLTNRQSSIAQDKFEEMSFLDTERQLLHVARRSSIHVDRGLDMLYLQMKMPSQTDRRRSMPNVCVRKNNELNKTFPNVLHATSWNKLNYLDLKIKNVIPSNAERRVQMKRSSVFQIYKYLSDAIPNMSNQTLADLQRNREESIADKFKLQNAKNK